MAHEWNLSSRDQEMIAARPNFKYEDEFTDMNQAIESARIRSLNSLRTIYTVQDNSKGAYINHTHGVLKTKQSFVATHRQGIKTMYI